MNNPSIPFCNDDNDDALLKELGLFVNHIDDTNSAHKPSTVLALETPTADGLSHWTPSSFPKTPPEQADQGRSPATDFPFNPFANDGIAPDLTRTTSHFPSEPVDHSSAAQTTSRAARRGVSTRRRYDHEKWTSMKEIIRGLYIDQGYPIPKVMDILKEKYDFTAS